MSTLRTFGLPGTINGAERFKLVKRKEDGTEDLDNKGNVQYVNKPRFIITDKDEDGKPLMTKIIRRDHEGKYLPGPTEIEINMAMDPKTRQAVPGTGVKILAQVVEVPTSKSIPNPDYYEANKDEAGNVKSYTGYDFDTQGRRKRAMPENYKSQTDAPLLTQTDARVLAAQRESADLKNEVASLKELLTKFITDNTKKDDE